MVRDINNELLAIRHQRWSLSDAQEIAEEVAAIVPRITLDVDAEENWILIGDGPPHRALVSAQFKLLIVRDEIYTSIEKKRFIRGVTVWPVPALEKPAFAANPDVLLRVFGDGTIDEGEFDVMSAMDLWYYTV